jgi:transposase InsO family protein
MMISEPTLSSRRVHRAARLFRPELADLFVRRSRWAARSARASAARPWCSGHLIPDTERDRALGGVGSMSRTAACCYDNAPIKSFFHTLKVELVRQRRWTTHDEARRDLFAYLEGYYNRQRSHSAIGYLTPEQAERRAAA